MRYSVIIPVYNRPDEVDELLGSLVSQTFQDFEVVVVEDGSSIPCQEVVNRYGNSLDVKYFIKPNSGPGQTRNHGAERSQGEYLIFLDSDCVLPSGYLQAVKRVLTRTQPCWHPDLGIPASRTGKNYFLFVMASETINAIPKSKEEIIEESLSCRNA